MNSAQLLSGEKLVANGAKANVNLPNKGLKRIIIEGTLQENEEIENTLKTKKDLLEGQRIEKRSNLSFAEWDDDLQKALVSEKKGPHWSHIGHTCDNKTYIFPEEALHLMEIGALSLKFEKITVSIQQAYSLLLGKSVNLYEYRVYSLLSREGYRLIRHRKFESNMKDGPNIIKANESLKNKNCEDQHFVNTQPTSNGTIASAINEQTMSVSIPNYESMENSDDKIGFSSRKRKICDKSEISDSSNVKRIAKETHRNDSIESYLPPFDRLTILDSIVDCFRKKTVRIMAPNEKFIPKNVFLNKKKYVINIEDSFSNRRNVSSEIFEYENFENNTRSTRTLDKNLNSSKQNFDNLTYDNKFVTNTPFFNHIYRYISTKQLEFGSDFSNTIAFADSNHKNENKRQAFVEKTTQHTNFPSNSITEEIYSNESPNTNDKYSRLLQKLKTFLSSTSDLQNECNRKILSDLIEKYNCYFGSNFVLNQKIIKPNCDDDQTSMLLENESLNMNVDTLKHSNAICRPDNSNIPNDESKNVQNWYDKDVWSIRPKEKNVFMSNNLFQNLAETKAFLDGIKYFSQDKESYILCWKQAKLFYRKFFTKETTALTFNHSSNHDLLSESSVEPLVRPQDCKNVSSVLKRLQIIGTNLNSTFDEEINILFDVYLPSQRNFKKSSPCIPDYCMIVWNSSSSLPSPMKLDLLRSKVPNTIKILFAIVSLDSVYFLEMENVKLPTLNESCNKLNLT